MKYSIKILLVIIFLLAATLRLYRIDQVPPGINWDEAAAGYNAYTIANWGKDEWGNSFPLVFTSFKDDKHPVHIYITAIFVKLLGLSELSIRLPSALIGSLSVVIIFFLAKLFFKSDIAGLLSALFLAISPLSIHFSRGLWEVNFAFFFLLLGMLFFFLAIYEIGWLLNLSFLSFGISLLSYHSSKIVVPIMVLLLLVVYFKDLKKLSKNFYISLCILAFFMILLLIEPRLLGIARAKQTQINSQDLEKTIVYKKIQNSNLALGEIFIRNYFSHFTPQYLFMTGDQSPRNSVKTFGEFYKIDAIFLIVGLFYLLKLRSRISLVILAWLLLSPIPASLTSGAPSATRALFMMGSMHLISAYGATKLLNFFKGKIKWSILVVFLFILSFELYFYMNYYINTYPKKEPTDWQYGMKQVVEYVKSHTEYSLSYMTEERSQPYIFFLFYLKEPLPDFLSSVMYTRYEDKSYKYNTVASFRGYFFGGSDPIELQPTDGVLNIITPSQYDGLKHRDKFDVKEIIKYPDGANAFYIISSMK